MAEHVVTDTHRSHLAHHFESLDQQRDAAELGMWLFLVTEFMFFGGLFMAYLAYRGWYAAAFAFGSHTMDVWLGGINTAVLLTSSLTMALAVKAAGERHRERTIGLLSATIVLGLVFLGIKAYEYYHKYEHHQMPFLQLPFAYSTSEHPGIAEFYNLYFLMTGLHAFHMIIGIALLAILAIGASRGNFLGERSIVVHNSGLYWHFVDLVWVFLFPFFYLVAARERSRRPRMNHASENHAADHPTTGVYYAIFAALLVLLVLTIGVAEIDLGRLNFPLAAAIATIKALLILLFFMHVRYAKPLIWLVAGAAFFWLAILFTLTLSDYWTRGEATPLAPREHTGGP